MNHYLTGLLCIFALLLLSCAEKGCNQNMMLSIVTAEIKKSNRNINDYKLAEIRYLGKTVYLGMAARISPLYRRHYTIDRSTCKIIDLRIDQ